MDPAIEAFAAEARRYCQWAQNVAAGYQGAAEALRRIVAVYEAALTLPYPPWPDDAADIEVDVTSELTIVRTRCASLPIQYYAEQFDPLAVQERQEPSVGDLVDDVSDIYADLTEGLRYFDQGREAEAAWTWTFLFQKHWGQHASSAIRALHAYLVECYWTPELPARTAPED